MVSIRSLWSLLNPAPLRTQPALLNPRNCATTNGFFENRRPRNIKYDAAVLNGIPPFVSRDFDENGILAISSKLIDILPLD